MQWFEVDRNGLAKLLSRKGKPFILYELIQNAWDENTTRVEVSLARVPSSPYVDLTVEDDNPQGFRDLAHAFTLFAESDKKADSNKRGRFNLGEKLVLALCESASIASTTGTIVFDAQGRHRSRAKTKAGSVFQGRLRMTGEELVECAVRVHTLIPPDGIETVFNGARIVPRVPLATFDATLPTEIADHEGFLRKTQRKTQVRIFEPLRGEIPSLYELGIPVVETGDRWHVDVASKIPLNLDRDNVTPDYLARVRALTLEHMTDAINAEDANSVWVREAIEKQSDTLPEGAIRRVVDLRFGEKRVAYDPSDPEANSLAVAQGYSVVHGGQLSANEWNAVRRSGAILPAGRVTPSPKPFSPDGEPLRLLARDKWTPNIAAVCDYAGRLGQALLGCAIEVQVANDITWPFGGAYGQPRLTLNLGRLGHQWFAGPLNAINQLLIHEFGHHYCGNHLSSEYHDALCRLGAQLATLALDNPQFFRLTRTPE